MQEDLASSFKSAWVNLIYSYGRIAREANQHMRQAQNVGLEAYDLLLILEDADGQSMDMTSLGERLLVSLSGISRLVARLEEKRLVSVARSPSNHRTKLVTLTTQGFQERERAWKTYASVIQKEIGGRLSQEEADQLGFLLAKLR